MLGPPWSGPGADAARHVSRAALARLPGAKTFVDRVSPSLPPAELTGLPLASLFATLPAGAGADGLVLRAADRWESWLPLSLIEREDPYLILYYNGKAPGEPDGWPVVGGRELLVPYHAYVSRAERPGFVDDTPFGMISASQVVAIEATTWAARYAPYHAGPLARLDDLAARGRALFLRACHTCHEGPGGVGGNLSLRPFHVLQTHATVNQAYFRFVVEDASRAYPETVMPKYPDLTPEQFAALEAFLRASIEEERP